MEEERLRRYPVKLEVNTYNFTGLAIFPTRKDLVKRNKAVHKNS
jgi:hypothetical protein